MFVSLRLTLQMKNPEEKGNRRPNSQETAVQPQSLALGHSKVEGISRLTTVVLGTDESNSKLVQQLYKLVDLHKEAQQGQIDDRSSLLNVYEDVSSLFLDRLLRIGMGKGTISSSGDNNRDAYLNMSIAVLATLCRVLEIASSEDMISKIPVILEEPNTFVSKSKGNEKEILIASLQVCILGRYCFSHE
ncbi:unnamed protein product [Vicia faba]|uniref:Uncharacterized protein n=1 Tax=Vicia faba TaxID=3906 RepID=A0AAV1APN7_VICFA|nr:unnamed protein product [Vicia faba]